MVVFLALIFGAAVFVVALLAPLLAALYSAAFETPDLADLGLGRRRIGLLISSVSVAAGGAFLALPIGCGLAAGFCGGRWLRRFSVIIAGVTLLTPPALLAYAWSLPLLPNGLFVANTHGPLTEWLTTRGRAIALTGVWLAPIAAAILTAGWRGSGRQVLALALQDAPPMRALLRTAPRVMAPWWIGAWLVCVGIAVSQYAICHICLTQTWSTELLAVAQSAGPTAALSWPLIALALLALGAAWPLRGRWRLAVDRMRDAETVAGAAYWGRGWARAAAIFACLLCASSGVILVMWLRDVSAIRASFVAYAGAWPNALAMGVTSAAFCCALAILAEYARGSASRVARGLAMCVAFTALLGAVAPAAVIADAYLVLRNTLVAVESGGSFKPSRMFDWWIILSVATTTRFAIVPLVAARIAARLTPSAVEAMSALDGGPRATRFARVHLPLAAPALAASALAVLALSVGEVAVTSVLAPPGAPIVGQTLLAQIHFGRNDDVVAFCLVLLVFCVACAAAAMAVGRLRNVGR